MIRVHGLERETLIPVKLDSWTIYVPTKSSSAHGCGEHFVIKVGIVVMGMEVILPTSVWIFRGVLHSVIGL